MNNHNNRPSISLPIVALDASKVLPVLIADKKMKILSAKYVQEGVITASGVNYLALQLKVDNVAHGAAVDTQAGVAARTALPLSLSSLVLEAGEYLSLDVAETGTFTEGTDAILVLDCEIVGN